MSIWAFARPAFHLYDFFVHSTLRTFDFLSTRLLVHFTFHPIDLLSVWPFSIRPYVPTTFRYSTFCPSTFCLSSICRRFQLYCSEKILLKLKWENVRDAMLWFKLLSIWLFIYSTLCPFEVLSNRPFVIRPFVIESSFIAQKNISETMKVKRSWCCT